MYLIGNVHIETFDRVEAQSFNFGEKYDVFECGVVVTMIERPNRAGFTPSGIYSGYVGKDGNALCLGDYSEMKIHFKNEKNKPVLIENLKFQWVAYEDFTDADKALNTSDKAANLVTFEEPIRMEIRREGKAFAWNQFVPPSTELTTVDLKNVILDELLFTTSRKGRVYFDNFNWTIVP
ncbi:hypothetical protein CSV86_023585 [Pseudomonas putida CSV86]|uniref:Uncharacterized protein n=1 Tax=Pseudomonas bharatica CSV86 TaxID=1005395 RepID=L1M3A7_9PSED|nr:hypothetical protein [Pseudomonas bharatica]NNJ17947.1 hypothetical protein [Pseudomonas bharatica CSV86]